MTKNMPNSWRRQDSVLEETQSILAISIHLKHTLSLNDWTCSTEIAEAGLPWSLDWIGDERMNLSGLIYRPLLDRHSTDKRHTCRKRVYNSHLHWSRYFQTSHTHVPSWQVYSILLKSESYWKKKFFLPWRYPEIFIILSTLSTITLLPEERVPYTPL